MAGLRAGIGSAKTLIRMRVILAGEGVVRDERGVFRATLPGDGHMVEIDDRGGTSQMLRASGTPLSEKMDLNGETSFVSFMHNVDACISRSGRIPTVLLALADEYARVCAEGDAVLSSIVSENHIELGAGGETWAPGPAFRALAEAGRHSQDKFLSDAAETAASFANDEYGDRPRYAEQVSLLRWFDQVERWGTNDAASYPAGTGTWVQVMTRGGLSAAALRVGSTLSELLTGKDGERLTMEGVAPYALYDEAGDFAAVAVAHDGNLSVRLAEGGETVDDEVEILRAEVCRANAAGPRV